MAGYKEASQRVSACALVLHELVPSPETVSLVVALADEARALDGLLAAVAEPVPAAEPEPWSTKLRGVFWS